MWVSSAVQRPWVTGDYESEWFMVSSQRQKVELNNELCLSVSEQHRGIKHTQLMSQVVVIVFFKYSTLRNSRQIVSQKPEGCFPVGCFVLLCSEVFFVEVEFGFSRIHVWVFGALLQQDFCQSFRAAQEGSHHRPENKNTTRRWDVMMIKKVFYRVIQEVKSFLDDFTLGVYRHAKASKSRFETKLYSRNNRLQSVTKKKKILCIMITTQGDFLLFFWITHLFKLY